jgi:hypothetical protein
MERVLKLFDDISDDRILTLFLIERLLRLEIPLASSFCDAIAQDIYSDISRDFRRMLLTFEPFIAQLLNASCMNFDIDVFLTIFRDLLSMVEQSIELPTAFRAHIYGHFLRMLDAHFITRLMANTSRFKLSHVVAWNSFMTALQDFQIQLPAFHALVTSLVMVTRLDLLEISPEVNPQELIYILKNWQLDELFDAAPEWEGLAYKLKVRDEDKPPPPREVKFRPFDPTAVGWRLQEWNRVELYIGIVEKFPFFRRNWRR